MLMGSIADIDRETAYAARAALLASGAPVEPEIAKTHNGLISAFSLHLVKTGRVSVELGQTAAIEFASPLSM